MKNVLQDYMDQRFRFKNKSVTPCKPEEAGPVITLSREPGCPGKSIAIAIRDAIEKEFGIEWKMISKEIFEESAKELNLHVDKVQEVFQVGERTAFNEILAAFSNKNFKNERVIRKTVFELIRLFACRGNYIIIGRGGNIIAADIPKSLHIRLYAPMQWRVNRLMEVKYLNKKDAHEMISRLEKERTAFRKLIKGRSTGKEDFDIELNCARFSQEKIVTILIALMKEQQMLPQRPG